MFPAEVQAAQAPWYLEDPTRLQEDSYIKKNKIKFWIKLINEILIIYIREREKKRKESA